MEASALDAFNGGKAVSDPLLSTTDVSAGYFGQPIVEGLNITVNAGEVIALLGANGAGKSTTMLTLAGALKPMGGSVTFDGKADRESLAHRARRGLTLITDDRAIFPRLTVRENLRVGQCDIPLAISLFPELERLMRRPAGLLSGGEQGMLTVARALARKPRVLLADELSLGLAPLVVNRLHGAIRAAADDFGVGCMIVEQHIHLALRVADRGYVMRGGRVVLEGDAATLLSRIDEIEQTYLTAAA